MKKFFLLSAMLLFSFMSALLVSCSSDDDDSSSNKEHDAHLFGEWVANDGKKYVHDYYSFNSDGLAFTDHTRVILIG